MNSGQMLAMLMEALLPVPPLNRNARLNMCNGTTSENTLTRCEKSCLPVQPLDATRNGHRLT